MLWGISNLHTELQSLHGKIAQIEYNRFKTWHLECSMYFHNPLQLSSVNPRDNQNEHQNYNEV